MDILRVLSSPDLEVRRKTLNLAMDLVTSRNIDELVNNNFQFDEKKILLIFFFNFTKNLCFTGSGLEKRNQQNFRNWSWFQSRCG